MAQQPEMEPEGPTAPWPATAASLLALVAFGMSGGGWVPMGLVGVALLATYFSDRRLTRGSISVWVVRLSLYGALIAAVLSDPELTRGSMALLLYIHLFGQLSAAELIVQYWQSRPSSGPRAANAVLLSGMVFLAASKTFDPRYIQWLTPPYVILIALTLRGLRKRHVPERAPLLHAFAGTAGLAALGLALAIGLGSSAALWASRNQLTDWFLKMMSPPAMLETTGLSGAPQLGATFDLQLSTKRVMWVHGKVTQHHFHAMAFDTYAGGGWGPAITSRKFTPVAAPELQPDAPGERLWVTRLVDDFRLLPAPLHIAGLQVARREIEFARDDGGPLRTWVWLQAPYSYEIVLAPTAQFQGPLCIPPNDETRRRCLALPKDLDPRVRILAESIGAAIADPQLKINAVENYLMKHHSYSLSTDPGRGDPVTNFLLEKKNAHCEYFASSAAILLRCLGVPTRYVVGYYAHEMEDANLCVVRQRDAHAWAESWIDGLGWVTVEATPSSGRPDELATGLPFWRRVWEWLQDVFAAAREWLAERSAAEMIGALAALGAIFAALQIMRNYRGKARKLSLEFSYQNPDRALVELGAAFEMLLRKKQVPCPKHKTWREHLAELTRSGKPFPAEEAFARRYSMIRFGAPVDAAALADLKRLLQSAETN